MQVRMRSLRLQDFKDNSSELNHMTINKDFLKISQQCANNVLSYLKILRKNFLGIVKRVVVACVCLLVRDERVSVYILNQYYFLGVLAAASWETMFN